MEGRKKFARIKKIGTGIFGDIYTGIKGQEAVNFLLYKKSGEVIGALSHQDIREEIDLVWGMGGESGYGIAHIVEKHKSILDDLASLVKEGNIVRQAKDRILIIKKMSGSKLIGVIRLDWNGKEKTWLVSAFEKI